MILFVKFVGQVLPLKQFVQDGAFDNNQQKFITAYLPIDIPLENLREYKKYQKTVKYLDRLIDRVSLITKTNMFAGSGSNVKQKRKALVKVIIDIVVKHNDVHMKRKQDESERLEFFAKKFNIDKDYSNVYFFELDDNVFNFSQDGSNPNMAELNRLKFNNILLYFILMFIVELNGAQIAMMFYDKIANIYTFCKIRIKDFRQYFN